METEDGMDPLRYQLRNEDSTQGQLYGNPTERDRGILLPQRVDFQQETRQFLVSKPTIQDRQTTPALFENQIRPRQIGRADVPETGL